MSFIHPDVTIPWATHRVSQGKHTVNVFEQMSLIIELMTFHVKTKIPPIESGFLTSYPKQYQIQITMKCAKRLALTHIKSQPSGPTTCSGKDLKFNQKRQGAQPTLREAEQRSERVFRVVKRLRVQSQRTDPARKLSSALSRKYLAAFTFPKMFWHNY